MPTVRFFYCVLFAIAAALPVAAQDEQDELADTDGPANIIKLNLSALVFKNISVQYERKITNHFSAAINLRYMPYSKNAVLGKIVEQFAGQESVDRRSFSLGASGITPELRWYPGSRGVFNGFYLGAFYSHTNYKTGLPVKYANETKTGFFSGNITAGTFGLQLGGQWKMGSWGYLDWWAIGPNYGAQKGNLVFTGDLSEVDMEALDKALGELKNDLSFKVIDNYQISKQGAAIQTKGPWGGIRAMGFTIGVWF
ncbi:MAG TPA: DUF3575 domain-containing protein [Ferruginibacter sp.]|nr:DUF3575 domain-containing protein [Ferruginibacter sp.]HMP20491.1 DUF3575 domain-containing protein [Ferruginibacter sp.]